MKRVPRRLAFATPDEILRLGRALSREPVQETRRFLDALRRAESVLLQETHARCAQDIGIAFHIADVRPSHPAVVVAMSAWVACFAWPHLHADEIHELTYRWDAVMNDNVELTCHGERMKDVAQLWGLGQEVTT